MTQFDPATFASTTPAELPALVKASSKEQLEALMSGEHRVSVLDAIFKGMPGQFRADRAGSTNAVVHWNITGRADGGADTYELVIADGACTLSPVAEAEPKVSVTIDGLNFLQLISGSANPMMMFMTGKLKAKGDLGLAANLANLFSMPKS